MLVFLLAAARSEAGSDQFQLPTPNSYPQSVTLGPDGSVWFTEKLGNKIGRLSPTSGKISEFSVPTKDAGPTRDHRRAGR